MSEITQPFINVIAATAMRIKHKRSARHQDDKNENISESENKDKLKHWTVDLMITPLLCCVLAKCSPVINKLHTISPVRKQLHLKSIKNSFNYLHGDSRG